MFYQQRSKYFKLASSNYSLRTSIEGKYFKLVCLKVPGESALTLQGSQLCQHPRGPLILPRSRSSVAVHPLKEFKLNWWGNYGTESTLKSISDMSFHRWNTSAAVLTRFVMHHALNQASGNTHKQETAIAVLLLIATLCSLGVNCWIWKPIKAQLRANHDEHAAASP